MEYDARLRAPYLKGVDDLAKGRTRPHAGAVRDIRKGFKK